MTNGDQLLSPKQVAARLGVSPSLVRKWVRTGRLQAVKLGDPVRGLLRFRSTDVDKIVAEGISVAPSAR